MIHGGGTPFYDRLAQEKSDKLYKAIDRSGGYYVNNTEKKYRSRINVPFRILGGNKELEAKFLQEGAKFKLINMAGHKSTGGMRCSIYNAMPTEGVKALVDFMRDF